MAADGGSIIDISGGFGLPVPVFGELIEKAGKR